MKSPQKSQPYQTVSHVFPAEQWGICTRAVSACSAEGPRQSRLYAQTAAEEGLHKLEASHPSTAPCSLCDAPEACRGL